MRTAQYNRFNEILSHVRRYVIVDSRGRYVANTTLGVTSIPENAIQFRDRKTAIRRLRKYPTNYSVQSVSIEE